MYSFIHSLKYRDWLGFVSNQGWSVHTHTDTAAKVTRGLQRENSQITENPSGRDGGVGGGWVDGVLGGGMFPCNNFENLGPNKLKSIYGNSSYLGILYYI